MTCIIPDKKAIALFYGMAELLLFMCLAYGISWLIWLPLYAPYFGVAYLPVLPFHHALGAYGPLLAAAIMYYRQHSLGNFAKTFMRAGNIRYLLIALLSPFIILITVLFIYNLLNGTPTDIGSIGKSKDFPEFSFLTFILYNIFTFGYGEEGGWRGYALPLLQKRFSPLTASVILTAFWAMWHLPLFFYRPGYTGMDAAGVAGWVLSLLTGSILLTWLYNGSKQSLLVCAVFHATIDVAFTSDVPGAVNGYTGFAITVWGIVVARQLYKQKQLAV